MGLTDGTNAIAITATDPAGNQSSASLSVRRGTGKLTVVLGTSANSIKQDRLPEPVTLSASVTDPDGLPIPGAPVTFTLSVPGIPTVTQDAVTGANGMAKFATTVPHGADVGQGSATVLVSTDQFGSTQDYGVISIVQ